MNRMILSCFLLLPVLTARAQELYCTVQVMAPTIQMQGNSAQIMKSLENSITEFMNNRKWTTEKFQQNERIEMKLVLTITSMNLDDFRATAQIQTSRPVFGSGYTTVLMNQIDEEWAFKYTEFQPMEFVENSNISNLTSMLAFYAYMAIGMDFDSFSLYGGTNYFNKAQTIVNTAQTLSEPGWKAFDSKGNRNRYWFIDNVLSERFKQLREVYYLYHRQGLDLMATDVAKGRAQITKCLDMVQAVFKLNPNSMYLKVFFNAKADELVGVYSKAPGSQKTKIVDLLNQIDIANYKKYQGILNSQ